MSPRFKAVLVGNDAFPKEPNLRPLQCPARDVCGVGALLGTEEHGVSGPYDVLELVNRPSADVLRGIHGALQEAGRDDLVLLYYSGHGKLDALGDLYLATSDTTQRDLPVSSVPVAQIKSLIKLAPVKRVVLILDCCFSGAVEKLFKGDVADQASQTIANSLDDGSGTFILTASTSIQFAEEKEGDEYSVFTKHLIQGIHDGSADADDDGYISVQELFEYLRREVSKAGHQEPRSWFLNSSGRIAIARTGKAPYEMRQNELRRKILDIAKTAHLPDRVLIASLDILRRNPQEIWYRSETVTALLDRLYHLTNLDAFVQNLFDIYEKSREVPIERITEVPPARVVAAVAGAGVPDVPHKEASLPPPPMAPLQVDTGAVVNELTEAGKTELHRGDFVRAITLFEKAIAQGGRSKLLTAFLASAREKQARSAKLWAEASSSIDAKRWSTALASLQELVELRPEDAEARTALQTVLNQVQPNDVPSRRLALRYWFCNVVDYVALLASALLVVFAVVGVLASQIATVRGSTTALVIFATVAVLSLFIASLTLKNKTFGCWITRSHYEFKGLRIRFVLAWILFNILVSLVTLFLEAGVSSLIKLKSDDSLIAALFLAALAPSALNAIKFSVAQKRTLVEILANVKFCADMPR